MRKKKKKARKIDPRLVKVQEQRRRRRFAAGIGESVEGMSSAGRAVLALLSGSRS